MPEHSSTFSTAAGSVIVGSASTGCQVPEVKSSGIETASLLRSIDFGVATITGRCRSFSAWRRSRWKWLAGVDGCATTKASSAASSRNRSIRAEEWSGPWPS